MRITVGELAELNGLAPKTIFTIRLVLRLQKKAQRINRFVKCILDSCVVRLSSK